MGEGATAYFEKSLLALEKGSGNFVEAVQRRLNRAAKAATAAQ